MDERDFIESFGHIIHAPGGVTRVRELTLQLGVSGRLIEPQSDKVTADHLIEENLKRQADAVTSGRIKRQVPPSPIEEKDAPWPLPKGWVWTRLGTVTNYGDAPKLEYADVTPSTWVLELEDIEKGTSRLLTKVRAQERPFKSTKNGFQAGAVLYAKLRPYLDKVIIADEPGACSTEICPISFFDYIDARYLKWYLKTPFFVRYATTRTYGMNLPRLGIESAREAPFPFPPREAQERTVARVEELFALCDRVETLQQNRRSLQNALRETSLEAVSSSKTLHALRGSWARLDSSLGDLFTAPEDVGLLRNAILNLALRGILTTGSSAFSKADKLDPKALPAGWEWRSLGETAVSEYVTSGSRSWKEYIADSGDCFIRSQDIKNDALMFENPVFVRLPAKVEGKRTLVREGDLVLTITGANVGRCAVVPALPRDAYVSQHVALIRLRNRRLSEFVHLWMINSFGGRLLLSRYIYGDKPGLNLAQVAGVSVPIPTEADSARILESIRHFDVLVERYKRQLRSKQTLASAFATAAISALTGVATREDQFMEAPETELIANLRLGSSPGVETQAPLAKLLERTSGEVSARELWQRFGGEIDAFYAQLKREVSNGWIREPELAEVRERPRESRNSDGAA